MLIKNKILVARSSQNILFFRQEWDEDEELKLWNQYHCIRSRGFISSERKSKYFQVIEDEYIKFYKFEDEKNFHPVLQNVMYNFTQSSMLLFSEDQKFCISFKTNQQDLSLYKRKMIHDFKVNQDQSCYENALGVSIVGGVGFIVAVNDTLTTYDQITFN